MLRNIIESDFWTCLMSFQNHPNKWVYSPPVAEAPGSTPINNRMMTEATSLDFLIIFARNLKNLRFFCSLAQVGLGSRIILILKSWRMMIYGQRTKVNGCTKALMLRKGEEFLFKYREKIFHSLQLIFSSNSSQISSKLLQFHS